MGAIDDPQPVKVLVGVLYTDDALLEVARQSLTELLGSIDMESSAVPFDFTDYYRASMGEGLLRRFLAFEELVDPGQLGPLKVRANEIEVQLAALQDAVARPVNLDPGYITGSKLVLASTKDFAHRIYLGGGIYAEVTLLFRHGRWESLPWTYPDYRSEAYQEFLTQVRLRYLHQLRELQ